jgi:hypothetical protein
VFDPSFLPPADLEFVVMTDTHYMLDSGTQRIEFESRRRQAARAAHALKLVASLNAAFVVHLGDLIQEFPESHGFEESLGQALAQFAECGVEPRQVAGNHDVGDKPDPTMPTDWVSSSTLKTYHQRFGPSWYSWNEAGCHFVVLNSQIMNGPLPEVKAQEQWFEDDLVAHGGMPTFVFLHLSPFLVSENEQGLGHYDNIDEPARGWLLGLIRKHNVQIVFSGHSHFAFFNRIGEARSRVVPSTAFTRPGFCEVFSSAPPPERGRDDVFKLGFLLVRVCKGKASVHLIRTEGATGNPTTSEQRLIARSSQDLPNSSLGITLRHTLAPATEVPIAWQSTIRQPVRNDYPLLACLEAGVRHVRLPSSDLSNGRQRERLVALRDEGVSLTATWIWSERSPLGEEAAQNSGIIDGFEVQSPGAVLPDAACLETIRQCVFKTRLPVTLSPLLPRETVPGKQHDRTRVGYHLNELADLDRLLGEHDLRVDRVLCRVDSGQSPWEAIRLAHELPTLGQIGAIDWGVEFADSDVQNQVTRAVEAMAAVATLPGSRLYLEPLMDLDRTMDAPLGLIDRLSNPRPVFHAIRTLNTVLNSEPRGWKMRTAPAVTGTMTVALSSPQADLLLFMPDDREATVAVADIRAFVLQAEEIRVVRLVDSAICSIDIEDVETVKILGATAMLFKHGVAPFLK